ncbi:MAG: YdcF family protein [Pseudomonadota bacterium]
MGVIARLVPPLLRAGLAVGAITLVGVMVAESLALRRHAPEAMDPVDTLIVLGGGVDPDRVLDYKGRGRVDTAVALLRDGKAQTAIFTGRFYDAAANVPVPGGEARLMRERALAAGIAAERLIAEPEARTTLENLTLSLAIGRDAGAERFAIVTDAFHLPRALALAALIGEDAVQGVAAPNFAYSSTFDRAGLLAREAMAWWYNLGKALAWWGLGLAGYSDAERAEAVW